jgi:hypothetical protein
MTTSISGLTTKAFKRSRWFALLLAVTFVSVLPAHAQSNDAWKSAAIIGGSTAAGAYIGHRVAGTAGAYVGAAVGASAGYAIDRRRRQSEYYNNGYGYGNGGNYNGNGGYYGNNGPYYGNGGYYGDPQSGYHGNYYATDARRR